ncbi:MAG: membrane protein insertase YidC [Candidatus Kapabacteria bacterium]|nr:membrane protein insertase YidC [Candidatus Kapabacteria bacterium]
MDKQQQLGLVLIGVLITSWILYNSFNSRTQEQQLPKAKTEQKQAAQQSGQQQPASQPASPAVPAAQSTPAVPELAEKLITVETDNYKAVISSRGMTIKRWELKTYNSWYGKPVQLIKPGQRELAMTFFGTGGNRIDTRFCEFEFEGNQTTYSLQGANTLTLRATMNAGNGGTITRTMVFTGNSYSLDVKNTFTNMDNVMPQTNRWYNFGWGSNIDRSGLQYQEQNSVDESGGAMAFASLNGTLDELKADAFAQKKTSHQSGKVEYIGTKTKYFIASILNRSANGEGDYYLEGTKHGAPENGVVEHYTATYRVPYRGGVQSDLFTLYLGPLDYTIMKSYGMQATVNFGWKWLVRPIGEYIMLPIFNAIHMVIPNFGISIIVFSIFMKLILMPLSRGQMDTALKQKALQPEVEKLRKKYADDPTAMSQAQMKLFSEYGINPMGGCLPLLLQMPILYALYSVLTNNIQMRQAFFIPGWIPDLSIPDHIIHLPVPIFGIAALSGMALIMGITMFVQQKMTITDPNQKAMVYMMPVMMTLMFSNLPSGLNLYYLVFNFLGIAQQVWMTKFSKKQYSLEDLKKMPKKEGWLAKRLQMAQELAEQQQRGGQQRAPQRKKK